jgi:hypothetical protein
MGAGMRSPSRSFSSLSTHFLSSTRLSARSCTPELRAATASRSQTRWTRSRNGAPSAASTRRFASAAAHTGAGDDACREYEVVAVNDLGDVKTMARLLEFDSLLGRLSEEVTADAETITVGERKLQAFSIPETRDLPWRELGIDVVVESTGRFTKFDRAQAHVDAGAGRVVISAVANDADVMVVLGVNDDA